MSLPRLDHATRIADQLNELAAKVKTRSRASLTDANHILETIATRFFNALFDWDLVNLNIERANYPAADLGDRARRIAIQVTNEAGSDKIKRTTSTAVEHNLGTDFDRLIIFFLLPKKPGFPKQFSQPADGPNIETWDIANLLQQLQDLADLAALARAAQVLAEEMEKIPEPLTGPVFDVSRIIKYAPAELIGRETETKWLDDAWDQAVRDDVQRPHVLTFVALGGEGKTSLVAKWVAELAHRDWPGCEAVFAWSFYSQGTREQVAASSDLFLREALTFFGDSEMANSPQAALEKGRRLAQLVGQRRALLILDGVEPLQYAPTSPLPGQLKDQGLAELLKGLATSNHGLCVVTTRYSLPDLKTFWQTTAPEEQLLRLSKAAGVDLLQRLGVRKESGSQADFEKLVEDVKGHALTLNLLGTYLRDAHGGDIRKRDLVKLEEADAEEQGGHAFRVMEAYERQLECEGDKGERALAALRLMGLFDRPATADCMDALWKGDVIAGLTEPLVGISDAQRNIALQRLEDAKLLTVNRDAAGTLVSLDAHPLLREYFAKRLQVSGQALAAGSAADTDPPTPAASAVPLTADSPWRAAHRRLYEHLRETTNEGDQPTLEDLQPLYQAVAHGCHAGMQQEACDGVYFARVLKGADHYSWKKLGSFGSDLGAVACFFEAPWTRISPGLAEGHQALLLSLAAFHMRALGRLTEALEPMRAGLEMRIKQEVWKSAAIIASNLSQLELTLGEVAGAVEDAEQSVTYADRSGVAFQRITERTAHADALHQTGRGDEADARFREAETLQAERQTNYTLLYSLQGFRYCDLLLAPAERAAWIVAFRSAKDASERSFRGAKGDYDPSLPDCGAACRAVSDRAAQALKCAEQNTLSLLTIALDHLTLGRAALYEAILSADFPSSFILPPSSFDEAVSGLRRAGDTTRLPLGLLTRAWFRFLKGARTGSDSAQRDLDEAWEIAERGPMKLFMADVLLYRARLFGGEGVRSQESESRRLEYPWESPQVDLAAAEKLIKECGYHRRDEELADAKAALS